MARVVQTYAPYTEKAKKPDLFGFFDKQEKKIWIRQKRVFCPKKKRETKTKKTQESDALGRWKETWKALRGEWSEVWQKERWLGWFGVWNMLFGLLCVLGMRWDQRLVLHENVWVKPSKFAFSIGIFVWTVAWLLVRLELSEREKRWVRGVVYWTMWLEIIAVSVQAGRGVRSHFNTATVWDNALFGVMGLAILLNTWVMAQMAWWASRRSNEAVDRALLWGMRWGLWIFLFGSIVGGVMSGISSHSVGVADGGAGLPYLGWSVQGGDLRVGHFLGLHGLQILPLCSAFLLSWKGNQTLRRRWDETPTLRWSVHGVGLVYAGIVVASFGWALRGLPLFGM